MKHEWWDRGARYCWYGNRLINKGLMLHVIIKNHFNILTRGGVSMVSFGVRVTKVQHSYPNLMKYWKDKNLGFRWGSHPGLETHGKVLINPLCATILSHSVSSVVVVFLNSVLIAILLVMVVAMSLVGARCYHAPRCLLTVLLLLVVITFLATILSSSSLHWPLQSPLDLHHHHMCVPYVFIYQLHPSSSTSS